MQDHRLIPRWQIDHQASIRLEGAEAFADCRVRDINFKGVQIALAMKLPQDTFLKLTLALSVSCILDIEAWVVWQKKIDGHNYYGLYFSKIKDGDKEKIYKFIHSNFPQKLISQWWGEKTPTEGGEKMEDIRIFQRFMARLPVKFLDQRSGQEGIAETRDISAKGLGIRTNEMLRPRAILELWLRLPDRGEPMYTRGEVVWVKSEGLNEFRAGINLEKADLIGFSRVLRTV